MNPWINAAGFLALSAAVTLFLRHRKRRDAMYRALSADCAAPGQLPVIEIAARDDASDAQNYAAAFGAQALVRIEEFASPSTLAALRDEAVSSIPWMEHSCLPLHKRGNTLSYENILRRAPHCLSFYHNPSVQHWVSAMTGAAVLPTPLRDQSSLSILCYRDAGDHINWHYDHNFYRGRHFTVLLSLVNRARGGGPSASRLERQRCDGTAETIDTSENTLVVFEGARVRHRATATADGDLRIILSMTYCTDPRIGSFREAIRRVKDTAFYGIRALRD